MNQLSCPAIVRLDGGKIDGARLRATIEARDGQVDNPFAKDAQIIALNAARLPTIFPQPHDIPLDLILTEDGVAATRPDSRTHR